LFFSRYSTNLLYESKLQNPHLSSSGKHPKVFSSPSGIKTKSQLQPYLPDFFMSILPLVIPSKTIGSSPGLQYARDSLKYAVLSSIPPLI